MIAPQSKSARCLQVLIDGPATTGEVAAEVGITPHNASSHLFNLWKAGKVTKRPFKRAPGTLGGRCNLWELVEVKSS